MPKQVFLLVVVNYVLVVLVARVFGNVLWSQHSWVAGQKWSVAESEG